MFSAVTPPSSNYRLPSNIETGCKFGQVKRTCGRAYIDRITDAAASNGDACTIGIFLLRLDFTHNHGVTNLISSVTRYIFKSNDAESVCALNTLVLGDL